MSRTIRILLLAVSAMLVLFGTSASASQQAEPSFGIGVGADPGKNHTDYVRYYFTGRGVKEVRLYLVGFVDRVNKGTKVVSVPSKYLAMVPTGTSKYLKLANGRLYWLRLNPPYNASSKSMVTIAVKVRTDIPLRTQHCIMTEARASSPATATSPAWHSFVGVGRGFCMSGQQWLTPIIRG